MVKVRKQEGFTLIELVIVLAIAALIIAGILLAVSGAQKSRRDAQRKNDAGRILANMETYASNHGGVYPTAIPAAVYSGMNDPKSGNPYSAVAAGSRDEYGEFTYTRGGTSVTSCTPGTLMEGTRQFKIEMRLESTDDACLDTN